jgi:hypothetical protein
MILESEKENGFLNTMNFYANKLKARIERKAK